MSSYQANVCSPSRGRPVEMLLGHIMKDINMLIVQICNMEAVTVNNEAHSVIYTYMQL